MKNDRNKLSVPCFCWCSGPVIHNSLTADALALQSSTPQVLKQERIWTYTGCKRKTEVNRRTKIDASSNVKTFMRC